VTARTRRSRDDEGLPVGDEADVTKKAFIKDAIHSFTIVNRTIRFADQTGPRRGRMGLGHWGTNSGKRQGWVKEKCNTGLRASPALDQAAKKLTSSIS
jgi:hypothetical protein